MRMKRRPNKSIVTSSVRGREIKMRSFLVGLLNNVACIDFDGPVLTAYRVRSKMTGAMRYDDYS